MSKVLVVVMAVPKKNLAVGSETLSGPGICPACIHNVGLTLCVYVGEHLPRKALSRALSPSMRCAAEGLGSGRETLEAACEH